MTLTDIKVHIFGNLFFVTFCKYRRDFNTPGKNYPPYRGIFGPAKYHLEDFLYLYNGGGKNFKGINHFSRDNLSIFILNHFTQKSRFFGDFWLTKIFN